MTMLIFAKLQSPPLYHKQHVCFLLYFLGQIVTLIHWVKIDHVLLKMIMTDS